MKFFSPGAGPNAADAAIAIAHAVDKGAKVINLSWHVAPGKDLKVLRRALRLALTNDRLLVIAAGNDGTDNEIYKTWPAKLATQNPFKNKVLIVAGERPLRRQGGLFQLWRQHRPSRRAWNRHPGDRTLLEPRALCRDTAAPRRRRPMPRPQRRSSSPSTRPGSPEDVVRHLRASARTVDALRPACRDGKRLDIGRAVYGPLRIGSPRAGDELPVNRAAPIVWSNSYSNDDFNRVKIEFDDGTGWAVVKASTPNDGFFSSWTPATATATGRIRLTPVAGNFPVVSETFRVV